MSGTRYIGSGKKYRVYTEEEKRQVRQTDMIEFLGRYEGFTFIRTGNSYTCKEHDSFVIKADRQRWVWNSRNNMNKDGQGLNVLDYLEKIKGYSWQDAMAFMLGEENRTIARTAPAAATSKKEEKKEFVLPEKDTAAYRQVFAYLTQTRCIDKSVVNYCVKNDLIYQEGLYKNCVFVGYDENGTAKFAESKVTNTFYKKFNINVTGSDKRYSFKIANQLENTDKTKIYVFEAPVDLLSHCTLYLMSEQKRAKAENRPANNDIWLYQNRLSLSGKSDVALAKYLELYPETKEIHLCLDNDEWGRKAAKEIAAKFGADNKYKMVIHSVKMGKDYNECLQLAVNPDRVSQDTNQAKQENVSQDTNLHNSNDIDDRDNDLVIDNTTQRSR